MEMRIDMGRWMKVMLWLIQPKFPKHYYHHQHHHQHHLPYPHPHPHPHHPYHHPNRQVTAPTPSLGSHGSGEGDSTYFTGERPSPHHLSVLSEFFLQLSFKLSRITSVCSASFNLFLVFHNLILSKGLHVDVFTHCENTPPPSRDIFCINFTLDICKKLQSKHLKGHLAPRVSNVTFLDRRDIPGSLSVT